MVWLKVRLFLTRSGALCSKPQLFSSEQSFTADALPSSEETDALFLISLLTSFPFRANPLLVCRRVSDAQLVHLLMMMSCLISPYPAAVSSSRGIDALTRVEKNVVSLLSCTSQWLSSDLRAHLHGSLLDWVKAGVGIFL